MNDRTVPGRRVVSHTIRRAVGTHRRRDPRPILGVTAALTADIVALQQADRRRGARPFALPVESIHAHTGRDDRWEIAGKDLKSGLSP